MSIFEVLVFLSPILVLLWLFLFLLGVIPYQLFLLPVLLAILAMTVGEYRTWRSKGSKLSLFSFLLNLSITLSGVVLLTAHPEDVTSTPLFRVWSDSVGIAGSDFPKARWKTEIRKDILPRSIGHRPSASTVDSVILSLRQNWRRDFYFCVLQGYFARYDERPKTLSFI